MMFTSMYFTEQAMSKVMGHEPGVSKPQETVQKYN